MKIQVIQVINRGNHTFSYLCKQESGGCINTEYECLKLFIKCEPDAVINAKIDKSGAIEVSKTVPILDLNTGMILGDTKPYKTRKERAENLIYKSKICGKPHMIFHIESDEDVRLISVDDKNSTGTIVIPSFITSFGRNGKVKLDNEPFKHCKYTKIILDNDPNVMLDISRLFSCMDSTSLEIKVKHPECIYNIDGLFENCCNLVDLDISGLKIKPNTLSNVFNNCINLKNLIGLKNINTENVSKTNSMFEWCKSLEEVDLSNFKPRHLEHMQGMFYHCKSLKSLDLSNIDLSYVVSMNSSFMDCEQLSEINFGENKLHSIVDCNSAFENSGILSLDLSESSCKNLINFNSAFKYCKNLKYLKLPRGTENLKDISKLLYQCYSLESVDISGLNTDNLLNASLAFNTCRNLTNIDLTNFKVKKSCNISGLFTYCTSLMQLDLYSIIIEDDNDKVNARNSDEFDDMIPIIGYCIKLESVRFPRITVTNFQDFIETFKYTKKIKRLDISNIRFSRGLIFNMIETLVNKLPQLRTLVVSKEAITGNNKDCKNCIGKCIIHYK